jgi:hypothetical protein
MASHNAPTAMLKPGGNPSLRDLKIQRRLRTGVALNAKPSLRLHIEA